MLVEKNVVACAPETDLVDFGARVQAEAMRCGLARAEEVFVVNDGAVCIWRLIGDRFAEATHTLDFYHASEHLWALARHLHGQDEEAAAQWVRPLLHQLRHDPQHRVIEKLEELLLPNAADLPAPDQVVRREIEYLRGHRAHLAYQFDGNTYATVAVVRGPTYLLKSKSKGMDGPFQVVSRVPFGELMRDDDGSILVNTPGAISRVATIQDVEQGKKATERFEIQPPHNICFMEDCEVGLHKIDGKYMAWCTDWSGNYDMNYVVADAIEGPWSTVRVGVPHGGNGFLFRDKDKAWWYAYFNNVNDFGTRAGNFCSLNITPLCVGWKDGESIMEPKAVRTNRARLDQLGPLWHSPSMEANKTTSSGAAKP